MTTAGSPVAPEVVVLPDADALASVVANRLVERLVALQDRGGVPCIALTGGTIADRVHREVARLAGTVDWSRVDIWWGDERYVAADDPQRNALQARKSLLGPVGVDPDRIHEMPTSGAGTADSAGPAGPAGHADPAGPGASDNPGASPGPGASDNPVAAAAAYADELRTDGTGEFDVLMLGIGPDGHVASLFPGHPALDVDDRIAVAVPDSPKPPPVRISLTFAALNRSASVWFLASGAGKAEAVARALGGADRHEVPAAGVTGSSETVWLLDEAAASLL